MILFVNGKSCVMNNIRTVTDVLKTIGTEGSFFAVALNMECVPRAKYETTIVNENDAIEILMPMQGG